MMSSNASEARRLRPDRRKRSKITTSPIISKRAGTSKLYTLIQMSNAKDQKTRTSRIICTRDGTSKLAWALLHCSPFRRLRALTGLLKRYECLVAFQV
jgi:hypothetical protein